MVEREQEAMETAADRPDWGQLGLVVLALLALALAAVAIPALGGGLGSLSQAGPDAGSDSGLTDLESDGDEGATDGDSSGNGDRDGSDAGDPDGDETPAEAGTPGEGDGEVGDSEVGDGETGDSEVGDGETGDSEVGDGETGTDLENGGEAGEFDDADGSEDGGLEDAADSDELGDGDQSADGDGFGDGGDADTTGDTDEFGDTDVAEDGTDEFGDTAEGEPGEAGETGTEDDADESEFGDGDGESGESGDGDDELVDVTDDASGDEDGDTGDLESDDGDPSDDDTSDGDSDADVDGDADENGDDDTTDGESGPAYDVSFADDPAPGSEATATVTEDGEALERATVYFDGEAIGTTDADGTVSGSVPYTTELEVQIDPSGATQASLARGGGVPGGGGSQLQVADGSLASVQESANETRTTFELDAETGLEIDGEVVAGTERTVTATVGENPIPDGTVLVDGDEQGETDADGTATVAIPEGQENTTIAVERDEISAERSVEIRGLSVDVTERVPLPGRTVEAAVTDGDEPVANATVALEGEPVGETDADGTAAVELPVSSEATLAAQYDGATTETTVDGLYRNAAILTVVAVGLLALVGYAFARRYGASVSTARSLPAAILRRVQELLRSIGRFAVDAVVRLAHLLEQFGRWLADQGRAGWQALRRAGRWLVALPGEFAERGVAALAVVHPARLYAALVGTLRSLLRSSRTRLESVASSGTEPAADRQSAASSPDEADTRTLRTLWREFLALVRPPRLRTKTPGEIGRYAIDRGLPEPAVRTVVDAFRDSEYGRSSPSGERLERVRTAVGAIDEPANEGDDVDDQESDCETRGAGSRTEGPSNRAEGADRDIEDDDHRPAGGEST